MKQWLLASVFLYFSAGAYAQKIGAYQFSEVVSHPFTDYKKQGKTGTCWCFSALSFWESELLRNGKGTYDLSEMFIVRHVYRDKAENYVLRQGKARFSQGGLAHDVLNTIAKYGVVPQATYNQFGTKDGAYDHTDLFNELSTYLDSVIINLRKQPVDWRNGVEQILDKYFGSVPVNFEFNGINYTPKSYAKALGLSPDDYITVTSFMHHPYYSKFILEVPDNWSNGIHYNIPLDEMMEILNGALDKGYTVEWDADTHGRNFSNTIGLAVEPVADTHKLGKNELDVFLASAVHQEKNIDPAFRQKMFENYAVTDDHLMHITGKVKDQAGKIFYFVKNSSGDGIRPVKDYIYASESYMRLNTISFMVHKDAIPGHLISKLPL